MLRNSKSGSDVHLDWSLDGNSGPYIVERSTTFSFSNPQSLGSAQTTKTFDDAVLNNGTNYAYKVFRRTLTDTLYFYHADHLGTPIAMTNTSGSFVWQVEQYPFGGIYALPISTVSNNLRFPDQYFDGETGLAQNWFHDYKQNTGRYWEPDPLELLGNRNIYCYAHCNPIFYYDPTGLLGTHSKIAQPVWPKGRQELCCTKEREKIRKLICDAKYTVCVANCNRWQPYDPKSLAKGFENCITYCKQARKDCMKCTPDAIIQKNQPDIFLGNVPCFWGPWQLSSDNQLKE